LPAVFRLSDLAGTAIEPPFGHCRRDAIQVYNYIRRTKFVRGLANSLLLFLIYQNIYIINIINSSIYGLASGGKPASRQRLYLYNYI